MIRPARPHDAGPIAEVYLASRQAFLPYAPLGHSSAEFRSWVDEERGVITGFAAWTQQPDAGWIDQIYIAPGRTGSQIGSRLLHQALADLRPPVRLYTFQANERARRFYERHGFHAILFSDGSQNEERCPDVLYEHP